MVSQKTQAKNILVACDRIVLAGGLLRFERLGRAIRDEGHSLSYLVFSPDHKPAWTSEFPVLTFDEASKHRWDATFVPGAGFPPQTIDRFKLLDAEPFGLRVQHILNDQSRRDGFLQVNRSFRPHIVIFNNDHWPAGTYTEFQADRFFVIPGAVDTDLFAPAVDKKAGSQPFVIGALANKNPEPLITALKHLSSDIEVRFFGNDTAGIAEKHSDLLASGRISLQGPLFDAKLAAFYHQLDCVVMTEGNAGWSNLVAEAMASGIPVICTPHGTGLLAKNQETALVIESATDTAIATAVEKLRGTPGLDKSLASAARAVIEPMNWHAYSAKILATCDHRSGQKDYYFAPEIGLFGKWPVEWRMHGLDGLLDKCNGMSVLDLGAAEGVVASKFLDRGAGQLHGFEIDPQRVAQANNACVRWPEAQFRTGNLSDWNHFEEANKAHLLPAYDIVLYLGIHQHLPAGKRMDTLRGAARRASKYFALRTPARVFVGDGVEAALEQEGLYPVSKDAGEHDFGRAGMIRIYERKGHRSSPPLSRHFVSYPKSGRTWIRFMLAHLDQADPVKFHHDGFEFNDGSLPPHNFSVQERLARYGQIDRIVYLERDPRDVMVSLYHQVTGRFRDFFNYQGTLSEFIRDPYFGAHNLARFRTMWEQLSQQPNVLKITYEDCHRDPARTLATILEFFELDASDADIAQAVDAGSFEKMKELESSGQFPLPWLRQRNGAPKVRKGKVGGFRDSLSSQDIAFLDQVFGFPRERPRFLRSLKGIFSKA